MSATTKPKPAPNFSPVNKATGRRLRMAIHPEEMEMLTRGLGWKGTVLDRRTGRLWDVYGRPCGLGCNCDAEVTPFKD